MLAGLKRPASPATPSTLGKMEKAQAQGDLGDRRPEKLLLGSLVRDLINESEDCTLVKEAFQWVKCKKFEEFEGIFSELFVT